MHIAPYEKGNIFNKDPLRTRKLLLHKREITKLLEMCIRDSAMGHPVFVTEIDQNENKVIIGENDELFKRGLYASHVNLMSLSLIHFYSGCCGTGGLGCGR